MSNILLIEAKRAEAPSFAVGLERKGHEIYLAATGAEALELLRENAPDVLLINALSMGTSGRRIIEQARRVVPGLPIVVIPQAAGKEPPLSEPMTILEPPYSLQKVNNRLQDYLPATGKNLLHVGPFILDPQHCRVWANGNVVHLNPRLVKLFIVLAQRQGDVIEREKLFRLVWDTAYTADMRSLDVHISWLRRKLGDDSRHPTYIRTVRGVGYYFDLDDTSLPNDLKITGDPDGDLPIHIGH
mgnify:CR=1 FL=1